ncbi:CDP-glycerol glycerophosphotransferase family protein [Mycoplasma sp. P36-A1]|uniref:CDP-glycerol glycerophosphotransferase family protein n=1 Tax=Mycoplasma sp. P36-A1 TaxID=3252900 RepID=UPI003C3079D0
MSDFIKYEKGINGMLKVFLTHDYTRFNGSRDLILRVNYNTKYLLYDLNGERIQLLDKNANTLIDTIVIDEDKYIVFLDKRKYLSFSKLKTVVNELDYILEISKAFVNINRLTLENDKLIIKGVSSKIKTKNKLEHTSVTIGYKKQLEFDISFIHNYRLRRLYTKTKFKPIKNLIAYTCEIPLDLVYQHYLETSEVNIPIYLQYSFDDSNKESYIKVPLFNKRGKHLLENRLFATNSVEIKNTNNEVYMKRNDNGQAVFVMTDRLEQEVYENENEGKKLALKEPVKDRYLYFEKFAFGAGESAFLLFEYAMKQNDGLKHIYIMSNDAENYDEIKNKYPNNVFIKNSVEAFYNIFKAKYLISSDTASHIQRRLYDNSSDIKKAIIESKRVFLQHGPSLCTNVFTRGYYSSTGAFAPEKIIVSSKYEKQLFLDNTYYKDEQLLLTGIPNFDDFVNYKLDNKPKTDITFMLTWRPWDITGTLGKGSYIDRYLTFLKLVQENEFFNDKKVNLVLHPKATQMLETQFTDEYNSIKKYLYNGNIKEVIQRSSVLVTDYSSIMFFGFAGGSNIICYWEDKAIAEEHYGSPNIMQEPICFGDISYDLDSVVNNIKNRYSNKQDQLFIDIYNDLIETNSNNNTKNTYNALFQNDK